MRSPAAKGSICVAVLVTVVHFCATSEARAQATAFVGGAATVPVSDFGDEKKNRPGWMGFGGVLFAAGEGGLAVGGEGFYGSNNHQNPGDKTDLYGGLALIAYSSQDPNALAATLFGGAGILVNSFKSASAPDLDAWQSAFAASVGLGVDFPLGGVGLSLAAKYIQDFGKTDTTKLLAIRAVVMIPLGGRGGAR